MIITKTFTTFAKLSSAALVVFIAGLLVGRTTSLFSFVPCKCASADSVNVYPVDSLTLASGLVVPFQKNARGIDVSRYQGVVDWGAVRGAGITFAYAKASESTSEDANFEQNWKAMASAGLYRGAYHFFHAGIDPVEQANFFVKTVGAMQIDDLPPMLDVETKSLGGLSTDSLAAWVNQWMTVVEDSMGKRPIFYSNADFYRAHLGSLVQYPMWIADYSGDPQDLGRLWTFWQYSDSGRVAGIHGNVDLDVFRGPVDSLLAFIERSNGR